MVNPKIENARPSSMEIEKSVRRALHEDVGSGDITASLIEAEHHSSAEIISRQSSVLCGMNWVDKTFQLLDSSVKVFWMAEDSSRLEENQVVCRVEGNTRAILTGERTAINFLQTLSATATTTAQYVEKIKNLDVEILDTRKTIPGLREAQKYAVACGGGKNHRHGLYDGILIKENHIAAAGSIGNAVRTMREKRPDMKIEVEVENEQEISESLEAGADIILLDNFTEESLAKILPIGFGNTKIEISGNVTLETIGSLGNLTIDFISIGALTKNIQAIDFSLRLV